MNEKQTARLKHLEFILGITDRLARNSFVLKGWSVTLVATIFLISTRGADPLLVTVTALLPSLTFWGLDAYYLRQERLYRKLYDEVRLDKSDDARNPFTLNAKPYRKKVQGWWAAVFSPTVVGFHGVVVAVVTIASLYFLVTGDYRHSEGAGFTNRYVEAPSASD